MTTWVVFCTAQMSKELLETFIKESTQGRFTPKDPSPWVLQKTPAAPVAGPCFGVPAPIFQTGFENAPILSLQEFVTTKINDKGDMPDVPGELSNSSFIVLDKRSIVDLTCEVHYRYDHMPEGEWLEYDKALEIQEWKVWRVRFRMAWPLLAGLWHGPEDIFDMFEGGTKAYIDEKGVAQLAAVEQDTYEFPEFEDRAPLGPEERTTSGTSD